MLKVSDATYHFPLNDPLGNHIHGFLHKREHTLVSAAVDGKKAIAKTEYIYDKNDEFFETYPVSFKAEFTFTLSDDGLEYAFTMTNTSDKQMPYGMCNHTTINGPFTKDGNGLDMRLYIPVGEVGAFKILHSDRRHARTDKSRQTVSDWFTGSSVA